MLKSDFFLIVLINVFLLVLATDPYNIEEDSSSNDSSYDGDYYSSEYSCNDTPTCPQNEVYSNCSNGICKLQYCTQYGAPIPFCPKFNMSNCRGGCTCKDKYLRNPQGICVPQDDCPKYLCTGNEVYSACSNGGCDARNCSQLGSPVPCVKLDPSSCIRGCVCAEGYLRSDDGKCIPKEKCPPKCPRNEVYSTCYNGLCRFQLCTQYGNPRMFCPRFNRNFCKSGCMCKDKYLRNPQGVCVPQEQCPKYLCSKNEVYSNCTNGGCDARNCSQLGSPVPCIKLDPANCKKGCICAKGYLRADNGTCVPINQCPCKKNEVYSDCMNAACEATRCSQLGSPVPCPRIDPAYCKKGCVCAPGYLRTDDGKCVPKNQCPPRCPNNEVYSNCSNGLCRFKFCTQYGDPPMFCPRFDANNCKGGCLCKDNYLRNPQGICVPQEQCPKYLCTGKNEVYSYCINGGCDAKNCSQLGIPVPCVKLDPAYCKKGCVCAEGYLRTADGKCVPKDQCPTKCSQNEVYSNCSNGLCRYQSCAQYGYPPMLCKLFNPSNCKGGCICQGKYLRNPQGVCVPQEQCPKYLCTGKNEVYSECTNGGCDARNCSQLGKPVPCVRLDPAYCKKGCVCAEGYLRTDEGICVPKDQCPPKCGDNEIFSNCSRIGCQPKKCSEYGLPIPCDPITCVKGCVCQQGYLRADNGTCIPLNQCPPRCPQNEVYSNCSNGLCKLQYCTQYGAPIPFCPKFNTSNCKGGCICNDKYLRNPDGVCVPQEQCPEYLCTGNEVYSDCTNGGCEARYCSQLGLPVPCVKLDPESCKKGCVCAKGYLRANDGKCIPIDRCPPPTKTECPTPNSDDVGNCSDADQRLLNGNTAFTGNFLSAVVRQNIGKSVIMSPFSSLILLAQLALYTKKGESYNQLMSVLNLQSKNEIRCSIPAIIDTYRSQTESLLKLAAKVYVDKNQRLTEQFKNDTNIVFKAEAENIDFSNAKNAADTINKWVESQTNNLIKDLVSPSMFSSMTRLVLTNAIYFLGAWVKQFNPNKTTSRDFYINENDKIQRKFMFREGSFKYAEVSSLDAKVLQIPYKGGNFTFVAILPNAIDGYVELVENLRDPAVLNGALGQLNSAMVAVSLPRYETATSIDLKGVFKELNITDIFDSSKSDLSDIIEGSEKLGVTDAVQKADITVNEVGTEAAAANAIVVGVTSVRETKIFNANHAFVYYILLNNNPLFCGVVAAN